MNPCRWTTSTTRYGPDPGVLHSTFAYGAGDGSLVWVQQVRGPLWSITLRVRQSEGERAIEFRGTAEEARSFAECVLGWYERRGMT